MKAEQLFGVKPGSKPGQLFGNKTGQVFEKKQNKWKMIISNHSFNFNWLETTSKNGRNSDWCI